MFCSRKQWARQGDRPTKEQLKTIYKIGVDDAEQVMKFLQDRVYELIVILLVVVSHRCIYMSCYSVLFLLTG